MNILLSIDFLGSAYNITYKDSTRTKTVIGAFFSLAIIILFWVALVLFGMELVVKKDPYIRGTQVFATDNQMTLDDIPIIFTITNDYGVPFPAEEMMKSIYFRARYAKMRLDDEGRFSILGMDMAIKPCIRSDLSDEFRALMERAGQARFFLCVDRSRLVNNSTGEPVEGETPNMRNPFGHQDSDNISIVLARCNEEENPGCSEWLKNNNYFYVSRYYFTHYYDFSNFDEPVARFEQNYNVRIDANLNLKNYTRFKVNTLTTDSGIIFKNENTISFFTVEKEYQYVALAREDQNICTFYHETSFLRDEYYRKYITVQEVLANVGGFLKAITVIVSIFVKYYSQFVFYNDFKDELKKKRSSMQIEESMRGDRTVIREQESSVQEISKINVETKKVSIWKFLLATVSNKQDKRHKVNKADVFKFLDLAFIADRILSFELKLEAMKISTFERRS